MKKEGCKVFVVTGNVRKNRSKPAGVFEDYNFKYDSDSIPFILNSVEADIVIFTGASDSGFNWKNESEYIAGLTNIMMHLKDQNIKQFIYISSCSVFDGNKEEVITENTEPIPINNREKTILMGEKICTNLHKEINFSIIIVRVSEIYGIYKDEVLENNICTQICKAATIGSNVSVYNNIQHNLIYVDDVVDSIFRILKKDSDENMLYHITSKNSVYKEEQLVKLLEELTDQKFEIDIIEACNTNSNHIYQLENINKLGFNEKYDINKGINNVYNILKTNENKKDKFKKSINLFSFSDKTKKKVFPFVENFLFFFILQFFVIITKSMSFHEAIDVYLLYVIITAITYGYVQAILAIIYCIIGKIYIVISLDSQCLVLGDNIYLWILQIFTIGVLVGYLKDNYKLKQQDSNDERDNLQLELTNIKNINDSNIRIKNLYEKRLINYKDSFVRIYNIVSQLDVIEPERVIFKSIKIICEIMKTKDVSIYLCDSKSQFCRLMAASSKKAKTMKKSMDMSSHKDICSKLRKQEIYVNNTMKPNYPVMVGGTYRGGHLQTKILIWSLPFESNNLYEVNVFGVLCKLVEKTMDRAYEYMENINELCKSKQNRSINSETFEKILQIYQCGEKEGLVDFSLLKVADYENMSEEHFYSLLNEQVRETDYIGINSNNEICILLTNTNDKEAIYVIDRLKKNEIIVEIGDENACLLSNV